VRTFARSALTTSLAATLLVACGESPPPISAAHAMPQISAIASGPNALRRFSASYQQLYRFYPVRDGARPEGGLLDVSGTLYGTTAIGGERTERVNHMGKGTIYRISTSGAHKVLYRFRGGSDGSNPVSGLLDVNGTLYGTTYDGGGSGCSSAKGCGTIYSVSPSGAEKVLYAFKGGSDGAYPKAPLIDVNGTLYGTTSEGGNYTCTHSTACGTVFSVTTSGQETVLYRFFGGSDGANPEAELIAVNGVLYGTTRDGGPVNLGTVFSITLAGAENVLYSFHGREHGADPSSGLINVNGVLYGTTVSGGGTAKGNGIVYRISTAGAEKVVYRFAGGSDGAHPEADLTEVSGMLYGTTSGNGDSSCSASGAGACGTVFSISTSGVETVLHRFAGNTDGNDPAGPLTNVNGRLYGTTSQGGTAHGDPYGYGTFFAVTP